MKIKLGNSFICDNSNECEKGCYFYSFYLNSAYEKEALRQGAKVVYAEEAIKLLGLLNHPKIIGITGTNGKTSTACAIYSIFLDLGVKAALCGTRGFFVNDLRLGEKGLTTPTNLELLGLLKQAKEKDCLYFVMEVSSHAIVQKRCAGLSFYAKVFTNLSQDHLDFHSSMAEYKRVKESFFEDEGLKVINADCDIKYNYKGAVTYGIEKPALYKVGAYMVNDGIEAVVCYHRQELALSSQLFGLFNLYNLLAGLALVNEILHPKKEDLEKALSGFGGVKGRLEEVASGVFVDFAHTPDGVENVLRALSHHPLIVLLGAGGNRDKSKRPLMGKVASKYAKALILTSDNPRFEDPLSIVKDLEAGVQEGFAFVELDRKKAIKLGLKLKQKNDFFLILGKGDETYQEIKGVKYPFSDEEAVKELLKED